jgi:hypothetical protein
MYRLPATGAMSNHSLGQVEVQVLGTKHSLLQQTRQAC